MAPVQRPSSAAAVTPSTQPASSQPTAALPAILLLDDDPASRKLLRRLLNREGYQVHEGSRASAVADWRGAEMDLAIVNLSLPEEGETAVRELRKTHPTLIVLVLSETPEIEERSNQLLILPKPSRAIAVIETVRGLMAPHRQPV
jgi:CheY-like chemotaxis protein